MALSPSANARSRLMTTDSKGKNQRNIFWWLHLFEFIFPRNALQLTTIIFYRHRAYFNNCNSAPIDAFFSTR